MTLVGYIDDRVIKWFQEFFARHASLGTLMQYVNDASPVGCCRYKGGWLAGGVLMKLPCVKEDRYVRRLRGYPLSSGREMAGA